MSEAKTETQRTIVGRVVSDKADKTITVLVERQVKHALYGKYVRRSSKFKAHDAENTCHVGDLVSIAECRPMSRHKNHTLVEVLERAVEIQSDG